MRKILRKFYDFFGPKRRKLEKIFTEKVTEIFSLIKNLREQNFRLSEAGDSLLPRLMLGIIDINDIVLPEIILDKADQGADAA